MLREKSCEGEKKIGKLGYEGISWTKSRVRCYKLDEVQKREEKNGGISWTKSREKRGKKIKKNI